MPDIYNLKYDNGSIPTKYINPEWINEIITTGDSQEGGIVASWDASTFAEAQGTVRVRLYEKEGRLLVEESPWFMVCDHQAIHGVADLLSTKKLDAFAYCPPLAMFIDGVCPNTIYRDGQRVLEHIRNDTEPPPWTDFEGYSDQSLAFVNRGWGIFWLDSVHPELEGFTDDPLQRFTGDDDGAMLDCWVGARAGDPLCAKALRFLRWANPMEYLNIKEVGMSGLKEIPKI